MVLQSSLDGGYLAVTNIFRKMHEQKKAILSGDLNRFVFSIDIVIFTSGKLYISSRISLPIWR